MGKTKLKNVDYTMNFWRGCHKVSEGCAHCYARAQEKRFGRNFDEVVRTRTWNDPIKWQREAAKTGEVKKVLTCSISDFFHPGADQWRKEAWAVIRECPNLIWGILTKRPQLIEDRLPCDWGEGYPNVCLGVTVELKKYLWRMDTLRDIPAKARYLMAEPLLEDLMPEIEDHVEGFHQIMAGGETGIGYRPMDLQWARNLRDLCKQHNIRFYFKQSSARLPQTGMTLDGIEHHEYASAWDTYKPASAPPLAPTLKEAA
jgi:protein gp37